MMEMTTTLNFRIYTVNSIETAFIFLRISTSPKANIHLFFKCRENSNNFFLGKTNSFVQGHKVLELHQIVVYMFIIQKKKIQVQFLNIFDEHSE